MLGLQCGVISCASFRSLFLLLFVSLLLSLINNVCGEGVPIHMGSKPLEATTDNSLLKAAAEGDLGTVKRTIHVGANIDARDDNMGNTPLIWAAFKGHTHVLKFLIDKNANIEALSNDGHKTAIILASYGGFWESVLYLLKKGARVDAENERGDTSLALASYMNHIECVEVILSFHADVTKKTKQHQYTPLHLAAFKGNKQVIEMLFNYPMTKQILNDKDKKGNTPFLLATMQGRIDAVSLFLGNDDVDLYICDSLGNSALMLAVNGGHRALVDVLLEQAPLIDVDLANNMKQTPLIRAAMKGFVEIMRILLTKGADPLSRDENNHDAMDICETAGFSAGVELLEEYFLLEGIVRVKDEDIIVIDDIEEL